MKKILITFATLMALLFAAQSAQSAQVTGEVKVVPSATGMVFSDGIECGGGKTLCSKTVTWDNSGPAPTLSIFPHGVKAGHGITSWGGCDRLPHMNDCRVDFPESGTKVVYAHFHDVAAPTVRIAGYSDLAGDRMFLNVEASDNESVSKVEYLVNGEVIAEKTGDYFTSTIDTSEVPEGVHVVKVRAWDGNLNSAESLSYEIRFDHTPPTVGLKAPVDFTNAMAPAFDFDAPSDEHWWADCAIQKAGEDDELTGCGYGEPYSEEVPSEGQWEFVLEVSDGANNVTRIVHPFVVERTAPIIEFTAGPADGTELKPGNVEFAWTATDQLATTQTCAWDEAEAVECDGTASRSLEPGTHRLAVTATDLAGNVSTATRTIIVTEEVVDPDKPDPDKPDPGKPDPDTTDRTAPVVKLFAPKQSVKSMRKALRLNVRCSEACSGKVIVKGGKVRFSGRVYLTRAGAAKLKLRPTAKVRRHLNRAVTRSLRNPVSGHSRNRALGLTATANLKDLAGNAGKATLKFRAAR